MRRRGAARLSLRLRSALSLRWPCPAVGGGLRPPLVFYGLMGGGIRKDPRSGGPRRRYVCGFAEVLHSGPNGAEMCGLGGLEYSYVSSLINFKSVF